MQRLEDKKFGRQADAERVVLFGSYARGEATEHSDVDLLGTATIASHEEALDFVQSRLTGFK